MREATKKPITPRHRSRDASAVTTETKATPFGLGATAMPSVIELGRALAATNLEYLRLEKPSPDREVKAALAALSRQEEALSDLITTQPAVTLQDAAVQIGVAVVIASILESSDWSAPAQQIHLDRYHKALDRIAISVLPVIAKAAGMDLDALGWGSTRLLHANRFPGAECVA